MRVQTKMGELFLKWGHVPRPTEPDSPPHTFCYIYSGTKEAPKLLSIGVAFLHPKDHYVRKVGRAISLKKATKVLTEINQHDPALLRAVRGEILSAYFQGPTL